MPTTNQEAKAIAQIVLNTMSRKLSELLDEQGTEVSFGVVNETAVEIFRNLAAVAYQTDNYSLRQSLFMVAAELDPEFKLDNEKLLGVMDMYYEIQPEMGPQEFLGLNGEQWLAFTEGCHV